MKIRLASVKDVEGIARVHIESWRSTYKGIISESFLSTLTHEGRVRNWIWTFNNLNKDEVTFVAEDTQGDIVGFINGGKSRDSGQDDEAELYAIYLLEEYQGKGLGKVLTLELIEFLKSRDYRSMFVWVLKENPAISYYMRLGGEYIAEKQIRIGEDLLIEQAYGWKDINKIC